jgi:uncharacterized membrane protein YdjX (TVP38/TMEM64 family)
MKGRFVKLGVIVAIVAVAAALVLHGMNWRGAVDRGLDAIRGAGPWVFFTAMALLPAVAVPMLTFSLTAGSAFGAQMGMGGVVTAGIVAVTINLVLTYWLARQALRPWLARLLVRLGYRLPQVDGADMTDLIVLLRVTPGVPFVVQNYLLGLADVPVVSYLVISCVISWAQTAAFIVFGEALLHGRGRAGLLALSLILALMAAAHLARRHYGRKKLAAS